MKGNIEPKFCKFDFWFSATREKQSNIVIPAV